MDELNRELQRQSIGRNGLTYGKPGAGASKVRAGNRAHHDARARKKLSELGSRNAYREAIGLPPVTK